MEVVEGLSATVMALVKSEGMARAGHGACQQAARAALAALSRNFTVLRTLVFCSSDGEFFQCVGVGLSG